MSIMDAAGISIVIGTVTCIICDRSWSAYPLPVGWWVIEGNDKGLCLECRKGKSDATKDSFYRLPATTCRICDRHWYGSLPVGWGLTPYVLDRYGAVVDSGNRGTCLDCRLKALEDAVAQLKLKEE